MNGIRTANESPKTASSTSSAIGSAIASPLSRSSSKIGSRSAWIAGVPLTNASAPRGRPIASRTPAVAFFASVSSSGEPIVPKTTSRPAVWSGLRAAAFDGRRATHERRFECAPSSPDPSRRPRWKTTRNEPSSRWPNRSASTERTSSESVPGVVNSFESSLLRPELSTPPVSSTAAHSPTKSQRCRSTNLVQPSIPREVLPAGRPSPGPSAPPCVASPSGRARTAAYQT